MYIDTHCHIHDKEYNFDPAETLSRAHTAGVQKIIVIGTSLEDSITARDFALAHPGVFYSLGIHPGNSENIDETLFSSVLSPLSALGENLPNSPPSNFPPARTTAYIPDAPDRFGSLFSRVGPLEKRPEAVLPACQRMRSSAEAGFDGGDIRRFSTEKLVAIGEIGLDYHYKPFNREQQINLLEQQLHLAQSERLPCIFHVREAFPDFWPIISNFKLPPSVLHSFSDDQQNLDQAINLGFCIGINGLATFTKIPLPPLEHAILETDAPYLTPTPFRGKMNEPAYIPDIARFLSTHFGVTLEKVAEITTQNAERLFNI